MESTVRVFGVLVLGCNERIRLVLEFGINGYGGGSISMVYDHNSFSAGVASFENRVDDLTCFRGYCGTEHVEEFRVPEPRFVLSAERIDFLAIFNGERKFIKPALKAAGFVANHIAIQQAEVDCFPVIVASHPRHNGY